jgi:hypothetical protein
MSNTAFMGRVYRIEEFRKELITLINQYSNEAVEGGTVLDCIMADVMINALMSFNENHKAMCKWYGVELGSDNIRDLNGVKWYEKL